MIIESKKTDFVVVGDIHFCNQPPSCRIDDYAETCLKKISFILNYCIENEISLVVIEGDVFHKQQIPIPYLTKIISLLNEKKKEYLLKNDEELTIASIIGNHDLPFENFKYIERSPICLLFETGCLCSIDHITLKSNKDTVEISGFDYSKQIKPSVYENECCVAHCFFDFDFLNAKLDSSDTFDDRISDEEAKELGYKVYFLGHDHTFYGVTKKDGYVVVRPGSLLRNSSHVQQTKRIPCFYHVSKTKDKYSFKKITVDIALESSAIFTTDALLKPKKPELEESVKTKISDIIFSLSEEEKESDSVLDMLNEIAKERNLSKDVYSLLLKYFSTQNVIS